jgi:hypothetical protein
MMPSVLLLVLVVEVVARIVNIVGAKAINDFVRFAHERLPQATTQMARSLQDKG